MTSIDTDALKQLAWRTFQAELPELWNERRGQWIAYRGSERLGFSMKKHLMYQECLQRGLDVEEFVVFCIEPYDDEIFIGPMVDIGDVPMPLLPPSKLQMEAQASFDRDLPQLWTERPRQWVAYRGTERLGFAKKQHEIYQQCLERGLKLGEFDVFCIEPDPGDMIIGPLLEL